MIIVKEIRTLIRVKQLFGIAAITLTGLCRIERMARKGNGPQGAYRSVCI